MTIAQRFITGVSMPAGFAAFLAESLWLSVPEYLVEAPPKRHSRNSV
jgi:hypothetical protein